MEVPLKPIVAVVFALVALLVQGCASLPSGPATVTLATPCDDCMPGVTNFSKISPALWRGSQPTAEGFRSLENSGVKTIINLRFLNDDSKFLTGSKLKYIWIRTVPWSLNEDDLVSFFKVIQEPKNWPVFIHCWKGNDRSGLYVAAYRIVVDGWSRDDAIRELVRFRYTRIWFRIPHLVREIDVDRLKARIASP